MKHATKPLFLLTLSAFLLASCGQKGGSSSEASSSEGEEEPSSSVATGETSSEQPDIFPGPEFPEGSSNSHDGLFTIRFDTRGGNAIAPLQVARGEKATRPEDPTKPGETFRDWYLDTRFAVPFAWDTPIEGDYWLYAGYESDFSGETSSSQTTPESSDTAIDPVLPEGPYGPEGAQKNAYALVGSGSSFTEDWTVSGGLALYDNPGNPLDKGCLFNVSFATGDLFKVSDGTDWFGFEKVESNAFVDGHFRAENESSGNILCTASCVIDVYVNQYGNLWIAEHLPY